MSDTEIQLFWDALRRHTNARIGIGRSGDALPTTALLKLRMDHAAARDAVRAPLDIGKLLRDLGEIGVGSCSVVKSAAATRDDYLRRPDLGRRLADETALEWDESDLAIVLADGLSPAALQQHGAPLVSALQKAAAGRLRLGRPVVATSARVRIGDEIAMLVGARAVVVLIGERPGLSVANSIGAYLTHAPRPGTTDADRNCVSNIHPPDGLGYAVASRSLVRLALRAQEIGRSGVMLKAGDWTRCAELD